MNIFKPAQKIKMACQFCGKTTKNNKAHERFCPNNPNRVMPFHNKSITDQEENQPKPDVAQQIVNGDLQTDKKPSFVNKIKSVLHKKPKSAVQSKNHPLIIKHPDPTFTDTGLNDVDRLKKFLADAPLWTQYKPSWLKTKLSGIFSPDVVYAPCVFVGENRPPRILYLPYEPERNRLIIPKKGYYRTPTTGTPFFFHEDYMLPLVNSPNLKDKFQLPGHVVESAYAGGLAEGKLQAAGQLIEEIKKYKTLLYVFGAVAILALFMTVMVTYSYDSNYKHLAELYTNMSQRLPTKGIIVP